MARFNLSALAVRQASITLFLIVAIILSGVYAFLRLGRAEDPAFVIKTLTVSVVWPGATAQEMQDLVAEPLEKRIQELSWYDRVETFTRPGLAVMMVTLRDSTPPVEVPEEFYQARKKLGDEASKLPAGVQGPFVNDEYSDVIFAVYALEAHGMPPRELTREAETLRERLLHVPGVKKVNIQGERPERIFVDFSYARLANLGVSPRDIFDVLQRQNAVTPAGSIDTNGPQVFIRLDGAYDDLQKIRDTPIAAGGRTLRLGDIAEVKRGYEDPPTFLIRHDGEAALVLGIVMQDGWNGLDLGRALNAEEKQIAGTLPAGVRFTKVVDQAVNIREAVGEFMLKFFVALGVIMIVSLVSLGWRVGIVVAAAVPLTLAAVFVLMLLTGRVFDRITLGGVIIGLGLLVDDAIIAIEMMVVKLEQGWDRVRAASFAWESTAFPMLTVTLVTAAGFLPIGFANSAVGEYAGGIFWIVAIALVASWFVAVIFTPYIGVKLLPNITVSHNHDPHAVYETRFYRILRSMIQWCVNHRVKVVLATVGVFALSIVGFGHVQQQFFPLSERPELFLQLRLPEGTAFGVTENSVKTAEALLKDDQDISTYTAYVGQGSPRFWLGLNPQLPNEAFAEIVIVAKDVEARERIKAKIEKAADDGVLSEARVRVDRFNFGPPVGFPVQFRVIGPDANTVRDIAYKVRDVVKQNDKVRDPQLDWNEQSPYLKLVVDQDRARALGLTPQDVVQAMEMLIAGAPVTTIRDGIEKVGVVARAVPSERLDP